MILKILLILILFSLTSCHFNKSPHLKFMTSLSTVASSANSSNTTSTTNTTPVTSPTNPVTPTATVTPTVTVSSPTITNLIDKSIVETGFVLGTATSGIASIEISLDSGTYTSATGTTTWTYKLPTGSSTWKEGSLHTIAARAVDSSGNKSNAISISVRKGKNKDINGDGYGDIAIGATGYSSSGNKGAVYLFQSSGSSGVVSGVASTAYTTITGQSNADKFGYAIALGDINGDGYSDLVASSPYTAGGKGIVYIFHSSGSNGITVTNTTSADTSINGGAANDNFGSAISVGDINGDGFGDVIASSFAYPSSAGNGRLYIFHSTGSSGVTAVNASAADSTITGTSNFDNLGVFVSTGDVNGDGYVDVAAGAFGYPGGSVNGAVFVFHSTGASGITATTPTTANSKIIGGIANDKIGISVSLGDITGDGFADLAVGATGTSGNKGKVYLFYSSGASGISAANVSAANTNILGTNANDTFGFTISLGDMNGDGYADLAASANSFPGGSNAGIVYLFYSSGASGISASNVSSASYSISGNSNSDSFGYFTSMADFNGDGYIDLAVSAKGYNTGTNVGRAYLFHSTANQGVTATNISSANTIITGSTGNDLFGTGLPVF